MKHLGLKPTDRCHQVLLFIFHFCYSGFAFEVLGFKFHWGLNMTFTCLRICQNPQISVF